MPAITSMTVKKADGTTDITYDALKGAGGDADPAVWRQDTGQPAAFPLGLRPTVSMKTFWNGPKTARRVQILFVFPYALLNSTTGRYELVETARIDLNGILPINMPPDAIKEAVYQVATLLANGNSGGIKAPMAALYAPN